MERGAVLAGIDQIALVPHRNSKYGLDNPAHILWSLAQCIEQFRGIVTRAFGKVLERQQRAVYRQNIRTLIR